MPFDWMHATVPPPAGDPFREQFVAAVQERAKLFFNLGHPVQVAIDRIQAALRWEFDAEVMPSPRVGFYNDVPKMVKAVYKRSTPG